jgi:glycosyltransferase-like protein
MSRHDALRVALLTYSTQPRGGVAHVLALAEALQALGHEPVVFAVDEAGRSFVREPACPSVVVAVESRPGEELAAFIDRRVAAYVDAWPALVPAPFDVYHAHDGISANALATLADRGAVSGFVRTVHHLSEFADPRVRALQDRSIRGAERCVVVSALWQTLLAERFGISAAVVPSGVDTARFVPASERERVAARARLGFGGRPFYLSIGGIEARKNTLGTLEAFALVRAQRPDAVLAIAGGASVLDHNAYRRGFDARAEELNLHASGALRLIGVVADDEIVTLLQAADALVFPSLIEGFGLVVLEALACGTPVVVSEIAPFTEYLGAGDAAFVDPHDPASIAAGMLRAAEPSAGQEFAARGPVTARRFPWSASAQAHAAVYRDVLATRGALHA